MGALQKHPVFEGPANQYRHQRLRFWHCARINFV